MMAKQIFPRSHNAWPLVSFYGDSEQWLGHALVDFFDTVPLTGPRTELCRIMTEEMSDKGSGWHNYTLLYHFLFPIAVTRSQKYLKWGLEQISPIHRRTWVNALHRERRYEAGAGIFRKRRSSAPILIAGSCFPKIGFPHFV
jgi:hypothetical protein